MTAGRAFDHVVLAVPTLDPAATVFEHLGFTLTPRACHNDRMGTSNRLMQFEGRNFIELLEVDRPGSLQPHDFAGRPPFFSFGEHNLRATREGAGLSMIAFSSEDANADLSRWQDEGFDTFAPFRFDRYARLPDGTRAALSFTLGFVRSPMMPRVGLFVCENRTPEHFWKPAFHGHANGAQTIGAIYLASRSPERDALFLARLFKGEIRAVEGGLAISCGPYQDVRVLIPEQIAALDPSFPAVERTGPVLAGIRLVVPEPRELTPAAAACGMFIEWSQASARS